MLHEAIHALHAKRYPYLSRLYGQILKTGGTTEEITGILMLKWKAWTEYWAYRRVFEYENLLKEPEKRQNPEDIHKKTMKEQGVVRALSALTIQGIENFDPSQWKPPVHGPTKERRHEEETTH